MTSDETFQVRTVYERILAGEVTSYSEADMAEGYLRMLTNFGASFVRIVEQAAQGEPLIVHCTAGKDRTGVASMLLLDIAGVSAAEIVADYALSSQRRPSRDFDYTEDRSLRPVLIERGLDPDAFAPLWQAPAAVMSQTLEGLRERWGTAWDYCIANGASEAKLEAARTELRA